MGVVEHFSSWPQVSSFTSAQAGCEATVMSLLDYYYM